MKNLSIRRSINLPSESKLLEFEKANNIVIPTEYKSFILKYNGVDFVENTFFKENQKFYIDVFYPFCESYELSLSFVYSHLNGYFKNKYLAFANDSGGWQYVISIENQNFGKVYFCRMDDILPNSLILLANSFEEFIDGLQPEDPQG